MAQIVAELTRCFALREAGFHTVAHQAPGAQLTMELHLFGQFLVKPPPAEPEAQLALELHAGSNTPPTAALTRLYLASSRSKCLRPDAVSR